MGQIVIAASQEHVGVFFSLYLTIILNGVCKLPKQLA